MRYACTWTARAVVLTKSATSSPATALVWLAKPSSVWFGCTWLQIQLSVPGRVFSSMSQVAVGTATPLASVVTATGGGGSGAARRGRGGPPFLFARGPLWGG